ncbi:MAG: hypothetical protein Satyrvirus7_34 [Satyrvirus sp.]|uniref:Uncharacterized protein n=1 Tax=Satyrvirus sp. TaxID=2487771 RepID=A0A3G5ADI6_9VIRU|nr:MAG: hypothetical protein Satyrvirus7_34 [Satyrvirus sp.]
MDHTLELFFDKSTKYEKLRPYLKDVKISELADKNSIRKLKMKYEYDPKINGTNIPNAYYLLKQYDTLLNEFIVEFLIDIIKKDEHCMYFSDDYDRCENKVTQLHGLQWMCDECFVDHKETFICFNCKEKYCFGCSISGGTKEGSYCVGCDIGINLFV